MRFFFVKQKTAYELRSSDWSSDVCSSDLLLRGAHAMDTHFRRTPFEHNLPVLMGLLAVWNNNFMGCASHVLAPYAQRLALFGGWAQQLEMESNGKGVTREGVTVDYRTTPVLWGHVGTNAQHAYFQMLHQGPEIGRAHV